MKVKPGRGGNQGFAALRASDRRKALVDASTQTGILPVILEKDFWVSWVLGRIFADPDLEPNFIFKGGTSLSKVYQVIDRFSEDVDLGIHPSYLGYPENLFETLGSQTKRTGALVDMQKVCGEILERKLVPELETSIRKALGDPGARSQWLEYVFDDHVHGPIVYFHYESAIPAGFDYIARAVKLEIGSLTDQRPLGRHPVRPWLADSFPALFHDWHCEVTALELERTFWEKATILHAEHHRPDGHEMPVRHARHFADFARLLGHPMAATFLADTAMCLRVAEWKSRVFARKWARYELAKPGSFRLVPPPGRLKTLEKDYVAMRPMFLSEPQTFEQMMAVLAEGEKRINAI
jgi:hypothetical protein